MSEARHRFHVPAEGVQAGRVAFSAAQARQLASVLRLRAGARVRVFDGERPLEHVVELTELSTARAEGRVVASAELGSEPRVELVARPALLQRDKFEQMLPKLVEVGVSAVAPVLTARSLVREPPDERRLARWQSILREAAEQSGRARVPGLRPVLGLNEGLRQACAEGAVLLAYEGERELGLRRALRGLGGAGLVSLFVGPEGGYTQAEVAEARAAGALVVSLGPRILRTETSSPVLAALVLYELEP